MGANVEQLYDIACEIDNETDYGNIYNRLVKICDSIMMCDDFKFDLALFDAHDIKEFLLVFLEILDGNKSILGKPTREDVKVPNRKLIFQMRKEDVDNSLDDMIRVFVTKGDEHYGTPFFIPALHNRKNVEVILSDAKSNYIDIIRNDTSDTPCELFARCSSMNINDFSSKIDEVLRYNDLGIKNHMDTLYMIYMQMEIFSCILMQTINYKIINNKKISSIEKRDILKFLTEDIKILAQRKIKAKRQPNIFEAYSTYLSYLDLRNQYKTEINVMKVLNDQMDNANYISDVDARYQCHQRYLKDIETKKELRNIILEGREEKEERFNKNLSDIGELMLWLNCMAGRRLHPEYLQHIKVVYLEIIEDPLKYNGKQSRTIMRNFEKNVIPYFEQKKESIFIREKISRGLFRELGLLEEYRLKNDFQEYYYQTLLSCMSFYDALEIAENLKETFVKLTDTVKIVLKPIV